MVGSEFSQFSCAAAASASITWQLASVDPGGYPGRLALSPAGSGASSAFAFLDPSVSDSVYSLGPPPAPFIICLFCLSMPSCSLKPS